MCKKKNHSQVTGSDDCGKIMPQSDTFALPVMVIIMMEKLKLL
ncbi:hypothetical protein ACFL5Z_18230 [Planctomycetota bacterium]